jgi:AraC-like DNA-binding protein
LYALYLDKNWIEILQNEIFEIKSYIPFIQNIIDDRKLYQSFLSLCEYLFTDDFCLNKEEKVIEFISELMIKNCEKKPTKLKHKNILVDDIKNYIDKNITLNLSLEEISKQFLITPFYLIRVFKKELFLTPHQYILNKRVNLAKELLSQNISISEVAFTTGFNDQSHLYKYFKQTFSISPKEYQKSFIN